MKNLVRVASLVMMFVFTATLANAASSGLIGISDGISPFTYADLWTQTTDTGVSQGFSLTPATVPYPTIFHVQSAISVTSSGGGLNTPTWMNTTKEITWVATLPQTVVAEGYLPTGQGFASFYNGADPNGTVKWYIQNAFTHDPNIVSNYTVGTEIMSATLLSVSGSFLTSFGNPNEGTGSYSATFKIINANPTYIDLGNLSSKVFGVHFTGTTNVPSFYDPLIMGDGYVYQPGDIKMKVDGSQSFLVPEPSTFLLLGIGMAGFALLRKQSRKS